MRKEIIFFMLVSTLAFAVLNLLVKNLNNFNVYQIVFFRSIGTLFFTLPLLIKNNIPIYGNNKKLLIARGVIGCIAMTLFFIALKYLSTGTAVSTRYLSPIFASLFALVMLKEKLKSKQWFYFLIAFLGVLFLKDISIDEFNVGFIYIFISTILTALVFIIIRKLKNDDHPLVIVNYFMIISAFIGGVLMIFNWITPVGIEWIYVLSLGVFGYFGQYYMTRAIQMGDVSRVTPLKYLEVIFTMVIGAIWIGETYSALNIMGVVLIIIGLTFNSIIKKH